MSTLTIPLFSRIRRCLIKENGRPTRPVLWTLAVFAFYLISAGLALPYVLRPVLEKQMGQALNSACKVGSLTFNPFTWKLAVSNVAVPYPGDAGMFLRLDRLEITPSFLSLFRLAPGIKELKLDRPVVNLSLLENGVFSPSLFLGGQSGDAADKETPGNEKEPVFPFIINGFSINNGMVSFHDQVRKATQVVENINLVVPFASTLPADKEIAVTPQLNAAVNGRQLTFTGETLPFSDSLRTEFTLWTEELELDRFREYIRPYTTLELKSGALFTSLKLLLSRDEGNAMSLALAGKAEIRDLELAGPQGPVFKFSRAGVDLEKLQIGAQRIVVNEVFLESPDITVRRSADGTVDWQKFFIPPKPDPASEHQKKPAPPLNLILARARISNGAITWHDAGIPGFSPYVVKNIQANLADVETAGEGKADFGLEFGDGAAAFKLAGKAAINPLRVEGSVNMERLPLTPFAGYLAQAAGLSLDKADLALKGDFSADFGEKKLVRFSPAEISLHDSSISPSGAKTPLLTAKYLAVGDITADLSAKNVTVGKIAASGINAFPVRDKNGAFVPAESSSPPAATKSRAAAEEAKDNKTAKPAPAPAVKDSGAQPAPKPDWLVTLGNVQLDAGNISLTDRSLRGAPALALSDIKFSAANLSTRMDKQWTASFSTRPGKRGNLRLDIKGTLQPLILSFQLKADKADLAFLSPYLSEFTELSLSEAALNANINGEFKAGKAGAPDINVRGDVGLHGISLTEGRKEFGGFGRLRAEKFQYRSAPDSSGTLSIGSLSLNGPRIAVTIDKNGANNIQRALSRQEPAKTAPEKTAPPKKAPAKKTPVAAQSKAPAQENPVAKAVGGFSSLSIGGISVTGGEIKLRDERLQPPQIVRMDDIKLTLKKVSSDPASRGELAGGIRLNGSPIAINGDLNPLITLPSGKLTVDIQPIDLNTLSRYSQKFTGYPIRRGDFAAGIGIALDGVKLDVKNDLLIKKLELGDKDASSGAPDMPLKMAVSLLSDLNGDISLSLPISGRLDDPQFRLGGIVAKVIANIMLKTVTSPLSLLGGAFNLFTGAGGADLERIAFAPGEDRLNAQARNSLRSLADALAKRPSIKLELTGVADMLEKADIAAASALKDMRELKYDALPRAEREKTAPDRMRVAPDVDAGEYAALLSKVYASRRLPKAADGAGQSTQDMMRRIRQNTSISDARVQELATARGQTVRDELVKINASLAARITVSPPRVTQESGGERKADAYVLTKMK